MLMLTMPEPGAGWKRRCQGPNHWTILRSLLAASGTAGNLTSDAHLAALAIEGGWTLVSSDNDFRRFSGLSFVNPLAP